MTDVPYVSLDFSRMARGYEKRFQALPEMAGVLFVAVDAVPISGGASKELRILLGLSKNLDESVGWALIQQVMREEIQAGLFKITAKVFRGVSGACRDESAERPHQTPTSKDDAS